MADYPRLRPLFPILGLLAAFGCIVVGLVIIAPLAFVGALVLALLVFVAMARRARSYRGYFVYWRSLAETAKERNRERHARIGARRLGAVVLTILALATALAAIPLDQTESEDLRILRNLYFAVEGYDFESEDLRELFGPLAWYRPYRTYPNDLNALPDSYRQDVERIMAVEARR